MGSDDAALLRGFPPQAETPVMGREKWGRGRWAPKGKEEMVGESIEEGEGGPSKARRG